MEVAGLTKEKIFGIVIHTIAWGLLFCSPFLFAYGDNASVSLERYVGFVIMPLTFMTVFYVNYGILTPRLLFRKRLGRFILANLLLIAAVLFIQHIWHEMCRLYIETEPPRENRGDPPPVYFFIAWNAMLMALTVGLAVAIRMTGNWYRIEAEKQQIEKERTQAELKNLKSQLNPHFLFNTLNNIYALIPIDRTKAQFAVHSLSHMLRYVLYENNQNYIPLEKEIQFVRNYVELMELRLPDRVETTVDLPEQADGYTIAPLLFITLLDRNRGRKRFIWLYMGMKVAKLLLAIVAIGVYTLGVGVQNTDFVLTLMGYYLIYLIYETVLFGKYGKKPETGRENDD